MAVKIDCPRCKKSLSVPRKKAGGYARCPECGGRFWVPQEAAEDASPDAAGQGAAGQGAAGQGAAGQGAAGQGAAGPGVSKPAPPPPPVVAPARSAPVPPPPPAAADADPAPSPDPVPPPVSSTPSGRNVARFIPAVAAQSKLEVAEDGQLPELRLQDAGRKKQTKKDSGTSVHPLLLFAVLCLSVLLSILAVIYEPESTGQSGLQMKRAARQTIEKDYFGSGGQQSLKPYETLLREAQRAYVQGDRQREQRLYRRVLQMLRAERPPAAGALTGSQIRDEELEEHISVLLDAR